MALPITQKSKNTPLEQFKRKVKSSKLFDEAWYLAQYHDVRSAGVDPLDHFCRHGDEELRVPGPYFDSRAYIIRWSDVKDSGMGPLEHFLTVGRALGRDPPPVMGQTRARLIGERIGKLTRWPVWRDREKEAMSRELDVLAREMDDLEMRYYALKAAFDRSVREADVLRKLYAKALGMEKITILSDSD
jgi:hypothetical protein